MGTKKVRELTFDDIGKDVIYKEDNGDRASGTLKSLVFSKSIMLTIGNSQHQSVSPDATIEFV